MKKISILVISTVLFSLACNAQQNIGIGTTNPQQKLHIGGAGNTIRIDGIKTGNTFSITPSATSNQLLYGNANGDISSIPAGSNGDVMTIRSNGIIGWQAPPPVPSIVASSPLTGGTITTTGTVGIQQANTSQSGYLSSTD